MAEDLTSRTLLGKYRIVGRLGEGGMGVVWRASHVRTGRKLAIKVLDDRFLTNPGIVERFGREARAASAIQHPGIVEVLDLDQTEEGLPFLVMELLEGSSLADHIHQAGRLSQDETVEVMTQLLEALDAAHAHGVVHRDLKPDNIWLVPRGQGMEASVRILDFGISQKQDERVSQLTAVGSVLGTPHYMAPEQAMGESDIDRRADVYAAAVVAYECVVGDVPFDASNYNRLIQIILHEEPIPPRQRGARIDPRLEEVILRGLSKDRERRPQTAGALLEMLQAATGESGSERVQLAVAPPENARSRVGEGPDAIARGASPGSTPELAGPGWSTGVDGLELDLSHAVPRRPPSAPPKRPGPPPAPTGSADVDDVLQPASASSAPLELDDTALAASTPAPRSPSYGRLSASPGGPSAFPGRLSTSPGSVAGAETGGDRGVRPIWYLLGGLTVLAAIIFGLRFLVRPGEHVEPTAPAPVEVRRDEPARSMVETVAIDVGGLPSGARVKLDGLPAGSLPVRVRKGSRHTLEVSAPGYATRSFEIVADSDTRVAAQLVPEGP